MISPASDFPGAITHGTASRFPPMKPTIPWLPPPADLALSTGELHIWRAPLDVAEDFVKGLAAHLSADEIARADKFVFARDRQHSIVARGILRMLLGRYLGKPSAGIVLGKGPHDKPYLRAETGEPPLQFNLSHSHGLALYVFALRQEVGIDLERLRPDFAGTEVAERFFSAREQEELRALPPELRTEGFFLCWTRKEAYLKARGDGLRIPLESFDVTLTPHLPAELRSTDSARWTLRSFTPAPDYVAAVVAEGSKWSTQFFDGASVNLLAANQEAPC
jgi:4'-phosphopantetheinyl transferase